VCVCVILPRLSGMQITPLRRSIILSRVAYLDLPVFSTLPHKWHDFL